MPRISRNRSVRAGFTLVELIVVIVLIGLIAAIAVQRLGENRIHAYISTMKSDLRNFSLAEESHFYDFGVYSNSPSQVSGGEFRSSPGVTLTVNEATNYGWSATAAHASTPMMCYVYSGNAAPIGGGSESGQIVCN